MRLPGCLARPRCGLRDGAAPGHHRPAAYLLSSPHHPPRATACMPKTTLLPLLSDGEFHSGQDLADALGISRTAVWKQLGKLADLGLEIDSVKGRGYRIPGGIELLDGLRGPQDPRAR